MVNTLAKTTLREIRQSLGRYLAILAIIAIGVAIFSGLRMSQPAMIETGVVYLEEYAFYDFRLVSTLGFTEEDVEEFAALDGIELARGSVYKEFLWQPDSGDEKVLVAYSITDGVNTPQLTAGRLPENGSECLADGKVFSESDIGKTITLSAHNDEDTFDLLKYDEYTIVGIANTPLYINYERGTASIGSGSISAFILLPEDAFDTDIYYEIYLRVSQRADAYSDDYKPIIDDLKPSVERLLSDRAALRYKSVRAEAIEAISEGELELADGWREYREEKAKAEEELADALQKLTDGEEEYADGLADYEQGLYEYNDGLKQYSEALEELADAEEQVAEGWEEYAQGKLDAEAELADALQKLENGEKEYADGLSQYNSGLEEVDKAQAQLEENLPALKEAKAQLDDAAAQLAEAYTQIAAIENTITTLQSRLESSKTELDSLAESVRVMEQQLSLLEPGSSEYIALSARIEAAKAAYSTAYSAYTGTLSTLDTLQAEYKNATAEYRLGRDQYNEGLAQYNEALAQYNDAQAQINSARAELDKAKAELDSARAELDKGWQDYADGKIKAEEELAKAEEELLDAEQQIADGKKELEDAKQQLDDAREELLSAPSKLDDARKELDDGWAEYNDGLAEAEEEFAKAEDELLDGQREIDEAYEELEKLKDASTYTLTRSENVGYACFDSDTSIVAAISVVFPVFFFLVAALVCMTTMKRMVDEQRTQIGVLKAIGYSRTQITGKYLFYSGSAAAVGCIIGYVLGSTCLPLVLWEIYGIMYGFAPLEIVFDPWLAFLTFAASMLCSMGATYLSCRAELTRPAAELIRPKTPKAGKRVFLERITPIWKHLSFLQKVSVRNVLRYRSRFVMMVVGIGGCTALLVTGFGIKDSISNIAEDQYGNISIYDYAVSFSDPLTQADAEDYLLDMGFAASDGLLVHSGSTDIISADSSRTVYIVSPASNSLDGFISLHCDDQAIPFPGTGEAVINSGLAEDLGVTVGDTVTLQDTDLGSVTVTVSALCDNYISNYAYVSPDTYADQLGISPEMNTLFVNSGTGMDPNEESVFLGDDERVSTVSVSAVARDRLTTTLERLNLIVVVVVVCSAALAFVVLYNLTNINITERIREIATVKVLGFYPGETATYVFREVNMLAVVGSLVGLFMGRALHAFVMAQVQVEAMSFPNRVTALSYVLSFAFTMLFSVLITNCMRPKLHKIDMAESLKSIE